jgi:hypothetical protein
MDFLRTTGDKTSSAVQAESTACGELLMGGIGSDTAAACLIVGVTGKGEDFGLTDRTNGLVFA